MQDIGSKAILSTQLGICAITCVSMKIILKMINGHECRRLCSCNMILPLTQILFFVYFDFTSAQTIAPEGFCTIVGKPKPCKFVLKLKKKAQDQVESFGSWLQENGPPDVFI